MFYLRVVVLCSADLACSGGLLVRVLLSQFVTSLQRMSTEMLDLGMGHVVSFGGGRDAVFGTAGAAGCPVYDRDGIMASSVGSGRSRACAGFILQCVHVRTL